MSFPLSSHALPAGALLVLLARLGCATHHAALVIPLPILSFRDLTANVDSLGTALYESVEEMSPAYIYDGLPAGSHGKVKENVN